MELSESKLIPGRSTSDGFILVAVLWILGALSLLASIYAVYVINSAASFATFDKHLQAEALVSAATELTAFRQLASPADKRPTHGQFTFRLGLANVDVSFRSEAARIDLNLAPKQLLAGLFVAFGAGRNDADTYSDRIVAWRTPPRKDQDSEATAYQTAGLRYRPRGAKFPNASELALVLGLPPALVERVLPFVTVYSGRAEINILDAAPEVIAALPGMTQERLNAVLAQRRTSMENGQALLSLLKDAQQYATLDGSKAIRISVAITFDGGGNSKSEVVILPFDEGNTPFAILSWQDQGDGVGVSSNRWAELR